MAKSKQIKLYNCEWGARHPKHFEKFPHETQIATRDRHLVRTNNKDGYEQSNG